MHPKLFSYIDRMFGPHSIDRFASILTRQLPRYNSLYWDPETDGVDALHQSNWFTEVNFVNPPFRMLPQVINHICQTRAEATIIEPHWPAQTWARQLHSISVLPPLKLPKPRQMCIPCLDSIPEPMKNNRWSLYAWRVSGKKYLTKLHWPQTSIVAYKYFLSQSTVQQVFTVLSKILL